MCLMIVHPDSNISFYYSIHLERHHACFVIIELKAISSSGSRLKITKAIEKNHFASLYLFDVCVCTHTCAYMPMHMCMCMHWCTLAMACMYRSENNFQVLAWTSHIVETEPLLFPLGAPSELAGLWASSLISGFCSILTNGQLWLQMHATTSGFLHWFPECSADGTQVFGLLGKFFYLMSHLPGTKEIIFSKRLDLMNVLIWNMLFDSKPFPPQIWNSVTSYHSMIAYHMISKY